MTLVIVSGGIDLSVGSLMGLSAVVFGWLWREAHLPIPVAAALTLTVGALAGSVNGLLVARLRLPPLIVTLGTYSLFRGLAEGLTGGVENYTGWPESFLFLGQGYWFATLPAQLPILIVAMAVSYWWLHRARLGRALSAIGFSIEGAPLCRYSCRSPTIDRVCYQRLVRIPERHHLCGPLGSSQSGRRNRL